MIPSHDEVVAFRRLFLTASHAPGGRPARWMLPAALAVFFTSGVAALAYQVAWQRMLVIFSGADVHSATIVVAAFMAGLGLGSAGGGHVADRVSRVSSIALFAGAELAVALFGLISPTLFYDVLYERAGAMPIGLGATAAVLVLALLWPTFLMGASLPLLARGLTDDLHAAGTTVGWLYGVNTLGAAFGAIVTTFVLLPEAGMAGSVRVAAALNFACAVASVSLALAARSRLSLRTDSVSVERPPSDQSDAAEMPPRSNRWPLGVWAVFFGVSGFIALSLEIVWFRMLGVMLKSTSFTFGTLLALYLSGIGLGAMAGSAVAARVRRPALGFFVLQAGAGAYAALSLALVVVGLGRSGWLAWFSSYFAGYDAIDIRNVVVHLQRTVGGAGESDPASTVLWDFVRLYVLLPAALFGPPTFMAGFSFPLLQRAVHTDLSHLGRRTGRLLAANILGSTCGAFVTGWLLLDYLGTAGTLKLVFLLSAGFGAFAVREATFSAAAGMRAGAYACGALLVAAVVAALPGSEALWASFHGVAANKVIVAEDGSGLSLLKAEAADFRRVVVYVNGLGQSWIPYGNIHTVLGALPAFVHKNPRSAAVIGLGSGDTLFAMAGRPELERVTSIEIIEPQAATLRAFGRIEGYPGVLGILSDPRIEHVFGDGRLFLRRAGRKYDIIEADALRPTSAYSGNLFSDAYFRLLRDHLNPGGLAVTWAPTPRVVRTFGTVFPYVWRQEQVMIGSDAPVDLDRQAILERLRQKRVLDYYTSSGVDIEALLDPYLSGPWPSDGRSRTLADSTDINTDLYPRDEFDIPALVALPGLN